ncbi:MAG: hypothetical protein D4S01_08980 [Dehalococcoidia bacterium]|nr:MAG: hypothetical protein D4S01_08980 [Dehalococcoidia bacterium]
MSEVNKRIFDTIEKASFSKDVKDLLKTLLIIELRNSATKYPLYWQDYDRAIKKLSGVTTAQVGGKE